MDMNEFWRSLGLNPGASPEDVKKQYRALARKYHPDKPGGDPAKFREIHHAYKMLTDSSYSYQNTPKEYPINLQMGLTIEQAVFGARIIHSISRQVYGTPNEQGCIVTPHDPVQFEDAIPPGTLRLPHTISRSNVNLGNKKASVIVSYHLIEHPYYKVTSDGKILVNIELTAAEAMKGAKIEVQTLFGIKPLRIPAGTVPDDLFTIKKHGHLDPLLVRIAGIKYPRKGELQNNPAYAHLGINWSHEDELDRKEQEELDHLFNNLGGKPN